MLELSKPIKGRKLYPLNHLISSFNIVAFVKWTLGLFWLHGVLKKVLHGVLMGSFKKILEVAGTLLPLIMRGAARHYYITWKQSGDFLISWTLYQRSMYRFSGYRLSKRNGRMSLLAGSSMWLCAPRVHNY